MNILISELFCKDFIYSLTWHKKRDCKLLDFTGHILSSNARYIASFICCIIYFFFLDAFIVV